MSRRSKSPTLPHDGGLFGAYRHPLWDSLLAHEPRPPKYFQPERIVLAAGSLATHERTLFVERILKLYPHARINEHLNIPHTKIPLNISNPLGRHIAGKKTLLFGIHQSAVRLADEQNNTCPNYWHFSPYSFCPFDCQYCYLAGTRSVHISPSIKIFVNLPEIWDEIDRIAKRLARPTAFYLGKLQDALALESLTGYVGALVPRFSDHPFAQMTLLTKSVDVGRILPAEHGGRTHLSWSMSPPEIHARFERNVPPPEERLEAMRRCAEAGYPVRVNLMPIIPVDGWREIYGTFLRRILSAVSLARLTFGAICIYPDARALMEKKLGRRNEISEALDPATFRRDDRRQRFGPSERVTLYRFLADVARDVSPRVELALCLEETGVMEEAGFSGSRGKCNCVL